jgi:hypothetical protein
VKAKVSEVREKAREKVSQGNAAGAKGKVNVVKVKARVNAVKVKAKASAGEAEPADKTSRIRPGEAAMACKICRTKRPALKAARSPAV